MKKDVLAGVIIGLTFYILLTIMSIKGLRNLVDPLVFIGIPLFILLYSVINKEGLMAEKNKLFIGMVFSWFWPGLGQAVFAKQWTKLYFFTGFILLGFILTVLLWIYSHAYGAALLTLSAVVLFLTVSLQIYNLIDTYQTVKRIKI
tara:strand:- start:54 stop:491 length:438 start_codon:yes stop_codon:yes gene_type:complete